MSSMATNNMNTAPFRAIHPSEIIKDEIKARSITQKELSERMGMLAPNVTRLLKGENITLSIATKLEYVQEKLSKLEEFLGFNPLEIRNQEFAQHLSYNYKKSDKSLVNEINQTTWLTLAYIESRKNLAASEFKQGNAKIAAEEIATKAHTGGLKEAEIKNILSSYGIIYSTVEKLDKPQLMRLHSK